MPVQFNIDIVIYLFYFSYIIIAVVTKKSFIILK